MTEYHNPVLLIDTVDGLNINDNGTYVDVTFGGGGHSKEILKRLGSNGRLLAFDQDQDALLNRIDDIVVFNNLEKTDIRKIVDIELVHLVKRVKQLGYEIEISESAKDFLSEKGYDSKYGARPLNRAIQKHLEDLLAENVVNNSIKEGDKITIDKNRDDDSLNLKLSQEIENS